MKLANPINLIKSILRRWWMRAEWWVLNPVTYRLVDELTRETARHLVAALVCHDVNRDTGHLDRAVAIVYMSQVTRDVIGRVLGQQARDFFACAFEEQVKCWVTIGADYYKIPVASLERSVQKVTKISAGTKEPTA